MRSFSLTIIVFLCLFILIVDVLSFYWLQSITQFIASTFINTIIVVLFWTFTIGLISGILLLKTRLNYVNPIRRHKLIASLYGLTISSVVPKLLFVIVISILYFTNYFFSETESLIIVPLVGLLAGFLPFFIIIFGIFRTLYKFKVHHIEVPFNTLPKNFDGIRIIHISDLHLGSFDYRYSTLQKAILQINNLIPDYIFFTGDLINNYAWELRGWDSVFKQMNARYGKFAVLGNHDYGDYSRWKSVEEKQLNFEAVKQFYSDVGFTLLMNNSEILSIANESIAIVGVENWGAPPFKQYGDLTKALTSVTDIPFKILLSHDPSHWQQEVKDKTDIALTLSGHTHGMQAGFEFRNMKWSPIKYKYEHWAGLYRSEEQYLYVNRGLGWLGFPGRLGMRPEITLIELKKD